MAVLMTHSSWNGVITLTKKIRHPSRYGNLAAKRSALARELTIDMFFVLRVLRQRETTREL